MAVWKNGGLKRAVMRFAEGQLERSRWNVKASDGMKKMKTQSRKRNKE